VHRIFLLSPAYCGGQRSQWLLRPEPRFGLAHRLHSDEGLSLGELFSFLSGLYFRGKLTYSRAFERPPAGVPGTIVITPSRGLLPPEVPMHLEDLRDFSAIEIGPSEARFQNPFVKSVEDLAAHIPSECEVVLLGSIATTKYLDVLASNFHDWLRFPSAFAGRGDMSRGGLLLRCVTEQCELEYVSLANGMRHGPRPPKLSRIRS
jgi:hypothetical protein